MLHVFVFRYLALVLEILIAVVSESQAYQAPEVTSWAAQ